MWRAENGHISALRIEAQTIERLAISSVEQSQGTENLGEFVPFCMLYDTNFREIQYQSTLKACSQVQAPNQLKNLASGTFMYLEAQESAAAVERLLVENEKVMRRIAGRLRAHGPLAVMTVARGSSDNACTYGRYLIENATGVVGASIGPSIGSIYGAPARTSGGLCIAVSQSGASPDLLAAVERAKAGGALVVGMINQPGSPLAELCDEVVALSAGPERSIAATKSFITALAAFGWLTAEWTDDAQLRRAVHTLPELLDRAWEQDWSQLVNALRSATNLFVLGRGPGLGIAQEAALKLKETCGLHAEAFSAAEVAHGPMALVVPGFPVLSFVQSDASLATSQATVARLVQRGATTLSAGARVEGAILLPTAPAHFAMEPLLAVQSFYRAAANLSLARNFDPDNPPHLAKVTRTH